MKAPRKRRPRKPPESNVVALHDGTLISHPGAPDPHVIKEIRWLLDRAEAGELSGFAVAIENFDRSSTQFFAGRVSRSTVGCLFALARQVSRRFDRE